MNLLAPLALVRSKTEIYDFCFRSWVTNRLASALAYVQIFDLQEGVSKAKLCISLTSASANLRFARRWWPSANARRFVRPSVNGWSIGFHPMHGHHLRFARRFALDHRRWWPYKSKICMANANLRFALQRTCSCKQSSAFFLGAFLYKSWHQKIRKGCGQKSEKNNIKTEIKNTNLLASARALAEGHHLRFAIGASRWWPCISL